MADPRETIDFMLRQEDTTLYGKVTNAASDNGGCTRFGLSAKWHPELVKAGFFDQERTPRGGRCQWPSRCTRRSTSRPCD